MATEGLVSIIMMSLKYIYAAIVVITTLILSKYVYKKLLGIRIPASPRAVKNLAITTRIIILLAGIIIALFILGVDVTGALIAAGFTGIVVGLAAQQTLGNLLAGIAMLIEGRLRIGDVVRLGSDWGVVEHVGLLSTHIRLFSGEVLVVPNSSLFTTNIYNYSGLRARRIDLSLGISYKSDVEKAKAIIAEALWKHPYVLAEPAPVILVDSLSESSVNLKVLFWVPSEKFMEVRATILGTLKVALEKAGIEIPYPQRVVWLRRESSD